MQRESTLGRALWLALVVVLGGYVVADFARSPFLASKGSAALSPPQLTIFAAAGESGGEAGAVVQAAAAALELDGPTTAVKALSGGSSRAVAELLSRPARGEAELLAISSATLANLARDRHERLIPGAAEAAALARELLRRAAPVALLASDPLALAVAADSPIDDSAQLLATMREAPHERLFAIGEDTWSQVQLAALVNRAGVDGNVRFSVLPSGSGTGQAIVSGSANTVLATRGALRVDVAAGRLRELGWPFAGRPPRAWVGLVAAPATPPRRLAELREWLAELSRNRAWRARLREAGRIPGGRRNRAALARLLRAGTARADRLERLARRVQRR